MRRRRLAQVVVALLIGGLAFAITLQVRDEPDEDFTNVRSDDLVELLKSLDAANQRLDRQIADLTSTRNDLRDADKRSKTAQAEAQARADAFAILAGTVGASGPGITVDITDPTGGVDASALLDAVEELRNSGAEAIAVNGTVRVIGSTSFVDDDDRIRVDGRAIEAPFEIEAIGDSATLAEGTRILGGLVDTMENRGASVLVTERPRMTITALAESRAAEYARPES